MSARHAPISQHHAQYIGRVGALAVALGIGTAVAHGTAVAYADETGGTSAGGAQPSRPHHDLRSSRGGGQSGSGEQTGAGRDATGPSHSSVGQGHDPGDDDRPGEGPDGSPAHLPKPTTHRPSEATAAESPRPGPKRPLTRLAQRLRERVTAVTDTAGNDSAADRAAGGQTPAVTSASVTDSGPSNDPQTHMPAADFGNNRGRGQSLPDTPASRLTTAPDAVGRHVLDRLSQLGADATAHSVSVPAEPSQRPFATAAITQPGEAATFRTAPAWAQGVTTMAAPPSPGILSTVLSALGLRTTSGNSNAPIAPADNPLTSGILEFVRRQFSALFDNKAPTSVPKTQTVSLVDGNTQTFTLTGATDPDGDTVTYQPGTYTGSKGGTLVVDADASATYTAAAGWDGSAAISDDTFMVTTTDESSGWHIHGIAGLINTLSFGLIGSPGHTGSQTVVVSADQRLYQPSDLTVDTIGDGAVTGTVDWVPVGATDVTYAPGSGPQHGTVTVSDDGTFRYTPDPLARLDAYSHPGQHTDTFTVVATGADDVPHLVNVAVPISPTGAAATGSSTTGSVGSPHEITRSDGSRVLTSISGNDTDGYTTTVTVVHPDGTAHTVVDGVSGSTRDPIVRPDGSIVFITREGSPVADDVTDISTVTILDTQNHISALSPITGSGALSPKVYDDGTIMLVTHTGTDYSDYQTTATVLPAGTADVVSATTDGLAYGSYDAVRHGGQIVVITDRGTVGGHPMHDIMMIAPDGSTTNTVRSVSGTISVADDGTVLASDMTGTAATGYHSTVAVLQPGASGFMVSPEIDGAYFGNPVVLDDGTVVVLTNSIDHLSTGYTSTSSTMRVTALRPDDAGTGLTASRATETTAIFRDPPGVTRNGNSATVTLATYAGYSDPNSTVILVAPGHDPISSGTITGAPANTVLRGDGSVVLTTDTHSNDDSHSTDIRVLTANTGHTALTQVAGSSPISGSPVSTILRADGSIVQVSTAEAADRDQSHTTVTVLGTDNTFATAGTVTGNARYPINYAPYAPRDPYVLADGTIVVITHTGTIDQPDFTTKLTVLRPGETTATTLSSPGNTVKDTHRSLPIEAEYGHDGTVLLTTFTGNDTDGYQTTSTVLRPGDNAPIVIAHKIAGKPPYYSGTDTPPALQPDGTVVLTTATGSNDDGLGTTTITVLRPGSSTPVTVADAVDGFPLRTQVLSDGSIMLVSHTGANTPADAVATIRVFNRDGIMTSTIGPLEGFPMVVSVGDEGTIVGATVTGSNIYATHTATHVTVLRPGSEPLTLDPVDGVPLQALVLDDGTVMVDSSVLSETDGAYHVSTLVTVLRPRDTAPSVIGLSGVLDHWQPGDDGTVLVTTKNNIGTNSEPVYEYTTTVITLAQQPSSTLL